MMKPSEMPRPLALTGITIRTNTTSKKLKKNA